MCMEDFIPYFLMNFNGVKLSTDLPLYLKVGLSFIDEVYGFLSDCYKLSKLSVVCSLKYMAFFIMFLSSDILCHCSRVIPLLGNVSMRCA